MVRESVRSLRAEKNLWNSCGNMGSQKNQSAMKLNHIHDIIGGAKIIVENPAQTMKKLKKAFGKIS